MDRLTHCLKTRPLPFMAGTLGLGTVFPWPWPQAELLPVLALLSLYSAARLQSTGRMAAMALGVFFAGMWLPASLLPPTAPAPDALEVTGPCSGIAHNAPMRTQNGWKIEPITLLSTSLGKATLATLFGKGPAPELRPGDTLHGRCKIKQRRRSRNPGAPSISPNTTPWTASLSSGHPFVIEKTGTDFLQFAPTRASLSRMIHNTLSPLSRELTLALALGESGALPPGLRQLFANTGTSHLLAISGLHLALIGAALAWLFLHLFLRISLLGQCGHAWLLSAFCATVFLAVYTLFTHQRVATMRACTMISFFLLAGVCRKRIHAPSILGAAGIFLLLLDPYVVLRPGFQLSFTAVAALLWADPVKRNGRWLYLRRLLWACVVAWAATAPLTAFYFERIVWGAPIINAVTVPFVSVILLPASLLFPALSALFPLLEPGLMSSLDTVNLFFLSALKTIEPMGGSMWTTGQNTVGSIICLIGVFGMLKPSLLSAPIRLSILLALCLYVGAPGAPDSPGTLQVTFLDVGHGDATVIRGPDGGVMVVDGGGHFAGDTGTGRYVLLPALRDAGTQSIDILVLTHPDTDHLEGLLPVAARYPVREFWWNGELVPSPSLIRLLSLLTARGTRLRHIPEGVTTLSWGNVQIDAMRATSTKNKPLHRNNNSIVVRLQLGIHSFLLPGDIEAEAEKQLLPALRPSQVLKAPHHGSRTSNTPAFVGAIQPRHVVISSAQNRRYNLPSQEVLTRYADNNIRIHQTAQKGAVRFETDGEQLFWNYFGRREP